MTKWWGGILLLALLFSFSFMPEAAAQQTVLYACVNNSSGEAKLVSAGTVCNHNWTLVQWNVTGPEGPQGEPGPPGSAGQSIVVIDSKGVQVGQFAGTSLSPVVVLEVSGFPIVLYVMPNRLSGNATVLFETSDCSGPFFVPIPPGTYLFPPTGVIPPQNLVVSNPNGVAQPITVRSYSGGGRCDAVGGPGFPETGYPMMPLVDLNTMFTPPFSVKLK